LNLDGESLVEVVKGKKDVVNIKPYAVSQYPRVGKMGYSLRDGRYRYTVWLNWKDKKTDTTKILAEELYDYAKDPDETVNVAANSDYADVISILTPMYIDELSAWQDTLPEQRGEDYKAFKMEKARQLLEFIKSHGIDFTDHIETMYTTTPLSYRDFTGTCDGSAYGIIKDYKCPQIGFVSTRTKLGNLFLTGQNLNVHGALGVTLTSIITCGELLGHECLAKRIGHA